MIRYANLLNLQVMMLILILIGYTLNKRKMLTSSFQNDATNLIINIMLPCSIINSFLMDFNLEILIASFSILIISFLIQISCLLGSRLLFTRFDTDKQKILKYATICSNAGFMGIPLIEGISGPQGVLLASIYLIPQRIFMWSAGLACFTPIKGKEVVRKIMTHPCIIAVIIGLSIMLTQTPLPAFTTLTLQSLANCTTALSMIVIGSILADINLSDIINKATLYLSFIRLILIPLIVFAFCYLVGVSPLVTTVSTVLAGMPAGTTTAILANKYDGEKAFAVKIVFLSTALSMITIPILCIIVEYFI